MNLNRKIFCLIFIILLYSCAEYKVDTNKKDTKQYYSSSGFVLIYEDNLFKDKIINKRLNNEKFEAIHSILKKNTLIKIINPNNLKELEVEIYKKASYPEIFNLVISKKIALFLELDPNNPFVEIIEIKKNKTFIAKEGTIFDEEKNVADSAPVDEIKMSDLTINKTTTKKKLVKKSNFTIVISDFYYADTANSLKDDLKRKINLNNISVKKINNGKYRLLVGPFKNFNALKTTYISLNNLGFEGLNIYKD